MESTPRGSGIFKGIVRFMLGNGPSKSKSECFTDAAVLSVSASGESSLILGIDADHGRNVMAMSFALVDGSVVLRSSMYIPSAPISSQRFVGDSPDILEMTSSSEESFFRSKDLLPSGSRP